VVLRTNCELTLSLIEGFNRGQYDAVVLKQEPGNLHPGAVALWREQLVWVTAAPEAAGGGDGGPRGAVPFSRAALPVAAPTSMATAGAKALAATGTGAAGPTGALVRLVLSPAPCVYRKHALEALDAAGIPWTVVYTSPSLAGAAAAVRAGLGVTVLPRNMIPPGLARLPDDRILPRLKETEICILARPGIGLAAGRFAAFIREMLSR
jgi:DNA-binding transcriptional LysR family regulator